MASIHGGSCVADPETPWDHHWFPQKNSSRKAFNDKCGPFLELIYHTYSSFHDLFTTRYTPGWGEYSIHKWIEYDHPKGEYGVEFDKILRDSKNCCEALKEIRKLIYDYHRLGEYGPSFVGPIKVPLHRYRNANHSTGDLLDKFIDIACNQPPNLPPLTRRVPEPVLIPRRVPPHYDTSSGSTFIRPFTSGIRSSSWYTSRARSPPWFYKR